MKQPPKTVSSSSSSLSSSSMSWLDRPVPRLTIASAFVVWLGLTTVVLPYVVVDDSKNGSSSSASSSLNVLAYSILFFNNLNILIAICEINLGRHIDYIKDHYQRLKSEFTEGVNEYEACFAYLSMPLSVTDALFLTTTGQRKWSQMWSTYSLWDPSYQNDESFGFFIDVGNGWSTIPVNVVWNLVILCPQSFMSFTSSWMDTHNNNNVAVLLLGFVGTASYWQILYGTIIYLLSFVWNKRYQNKPIVEVLAFVGFANGLWFFFPIFCLWASYQLLVTQDPVAVFRS